MFIAVLAFTTGCGAEKEALEYDEAQITQVVDFMIAYSDMIDDASLEEIRGLRESVFEDQLVQIGIPMEREEFLAAIDAWKAGEEECGAFVERGEYRFEAGADELKVTAEATFEDRDATLEFLFDDRLYLETVTVSAKFSMGEILEKAALNTVLGMGVVFVVLIIISLIISSFKYIPVLQEKFKKQSKEAAEETACIPVIPESESVAMTDDTEIAAVIAAAVAATEGITTDQFVVRSIKRRKSNKWS